MHVIKCTLESIELDLKVVGRSKLVVVVVVE